MPGEDAAGEAGGKTLPHAQRRGCRRLLWTFGFCIVFAVLSIGGLAWWVSFRLERLVEQAIEAALPGLRVQVDDVDPDWSGVLSLRGISLRDRASGDLLAEVRGIVLTGHWRDLLSGSVTKAEIQEPKIFLTPAFARAFLRSGSGGGGGGGKSPVSVAEILCKYGEFEVSGFGPEGLEVDGKFTFAFENLLAGRSQTLTLWDVRAGDASGKPFLTLDLVEAGFSLPGLAGEKRLEFLVLSGGELQLGERLLGLLEEPSGPSQAGDADPTGLFVSRLEIAGLDVALEDTRALAAQVGFSLNTTLADIPLGKAASALGEQPQFVEIEDLEIRSPYDPLAKVITIRAVGAEFSLAGLLRREIAGLTATSPAIYVSQDLFWYMDEATKAFGAGEGDGEAGDGGWIVKRFSLADGRLILGSGGRSSFGLPLTFRTSAEDVALANLAGLKAQAAMEIPARDYEFSDYQLAFSTQPGELRFAYPPEKEENNLVGTVRIDTLQWRQYNARDAWVSVTFDRTGINGLFGGKAYAGYLSGGFSFFFTPDSPWIGWISGEGVDTRKVTAIAAPQNFQMTGPLDFRAQVDARRKEILRVKGDLAVRGPGKMTITKLEDLLARIPDDWPSLKQDSTRIALEALKDFPYDTGRGDFWFVEGQGVFDLGLQGPGGSRTFEIVLHADDSPHGRWKIHDSSTSP